MSVVSFSRRDPSAMGREAARLVPAGAACAVVEWPLWEPPDDEEAVLQPEVVVALGGALLAMGRLAARWNGDPPRDADAYVPAPRLPLLGWPRRWLWPLERDAAFGVVVTENDALARRLFTYDLWNWGAQQAIVAFDPSADADAILEALRRGLDWRGRPLPAGARLLFGPGHDAAFAVAAARDEATLEEFEAALSLAAGNR